MILACSFFYVLSLSGFGHVLLFIEESPVLFVCGRNISHFVFSSWHTSFPLKSFWFQMQEAQLKLPVGEKENGL